MPDVEDLNALRRLATELMMKQDFGPEAIRVNVRCVELSPKDVSAWTRLGRCYLEQRRFDESVTALRTALSIDPAMTVATNLLAEVRKRRAQSPKAIDRVTTGFSAREFALLETLPVDQALDALGTRMEVLFDSLNRTAVAGRIVDARRRYGSTGTKLFHANGCHAGGAGHVYAFHHGGRWEPQFNLGWFAPPAFECCLRVGIGFNLSTAGRDPDRIEGQNRALRYFERFQQVIASSWRPHLIRWLADNAGFAQFGQNPPELAMLPHHAVERIVSCRNPAAVEWIFIGRWLFLDRPNDATVLGDRAKLAAVIDDTYRALFPVWLASYQEATF
jgi:hypothetical protein